MFRKHRIKKKKEKAHAGETAVEQGPYERNWNTWDFAGKYHTSRLANKLTPLPGTQLAVEKEYEKKKQEFYENIEKESDSRDRKINAKLRVKNESIEFRTRVEYDTILGQPRAQAENLIKQRENILETTSYKLDDQQQINTFLQNIKLGRHHFVGYAISCGYKSINYQDEESGNAALHLAARYGHVKVVEELLKYKADPDPKNKLGYHPIHEAWRFWTTDRLRKKEEREEQEQRTCDILKAILSYDGYVNATDIDGHSALHYACRLGNAQAVRVLLSFKADYLLLTKDGRLATDVALQYDQEESYRLIQAWRGIRPHLVQLDYHMVWKRFLTDSEAVIGGTKKAEDILSEIEMEGNVQQMERGVKDWVAIDDPLLRDSYNKTRLEVDKPIPKPWEDGWSTYVKRQRLSGVLDLRQSLENASLGVSVMKQVKKGIILREKKKELPDRPTPLPRLRLLNDVGEAKPQLLLGRIEEAGSIKEGNGMNSGEEDGDTYSAEGSALTVETGEVEEVYDRYARKKSIYHSIRPLTVSKISEDSSALINRRLSLAKKISLDAKFLKFTNRLTQSSVLLLPQRQPEAPLEGTEEMHSAMRRITSQGPSYDRFEKYKKVDKYAELVGIVKEAPISRIGAYTQAAEMDSLSQRDHLFDKLTLLKPTTDEIIAAGLGGTEGSKANKTTGIVLEPPKRNKIDLVDDKRPRYVEAKLLPSMKKINMIEKWSQEKTQEDERVLRKKQGLTSAEAIATARQAMEKKIERQSSVINSTSQEEESVGGVTANSVQKKLEAEKLLAMKKLFLEKPQVKYGEGRLTSTHNLKGTLESPWSTIRGRHKTLPGDRTA